jgi:hypothetical protein
MGDLQRGASFRGGMRAPPSTGVRAGVLNNVLPPPMSVPPPAIAGNALPPPIGTNMGGDGSDERAKVRVMMMA